VCPALPDGLLPISPGSGGLLRARLGSGRGGRAWHCCLCSLSPSLALPAGSFARPRAGETQAAGCCLRGWGGEMWRPPCSPTFAEGCAQICAQILTAGGGQRAGAASSSGRWVPWGGHHVACRVYLQTGGSWHRAAGHQRDPAAYNVNYHCVIKSP